MAIFKHYLTLFLVTVLFQCLAVAVENRKIHRQSEHGSHLFDQHIHLENHESSQDGKGYNLDQNEMTRSSKAGEIPSLQNLAYKEDTRDFLSSESHVYEAKRYGSTLDGKEAGNATIPSSRSDFPCPIADAILPCVCTSDADYNVVINCTNVESEEQLASVFQQDFPVKELYQFTMAGNNAIKFLGNILNGVTFQSFDLIWGPYSLEAVSEYFFVDSLDRVEHIHIHNTNLMSNFFPFFTLNSATRLDYYMLDYNRNFTWIPPIRGPLITTLTFDNSDVKAVEPGTFEEVPNVQLLELGYNAIEEFKAGTFPIHEVPITFALYGNPLHTLEPGTFYMADNDSSSSNEAILVQLYESQLQSLAAGTFVFRNGHMTVDLHDNLISSIEPKTFVMPTATDLFSLDLFLNNNQLTTFDEEVFGELLPYSTTLALAGNPLLCDCDIAWLVVNPENMAKIDVDATCDDGTNLHELDPDVYGAIC